MAERSYRHIIHNSSSYLTLNLNFTHLCGGNWTPGWTPPNTIAPGADGGFGAESSGRFMWGTEGYVKYDVVGNDGRHGMLYIYWDNPWYGNTFWIPPDRATSASDFYPDCDWTNTPPGPMSDGHVDFRVAVTAVKSSEHGGDITDVRDLVHWLTADGGLFTGLIGIVKDPEVDWDFSAIYEPHYGSLGTQATPVLTPLDAPTFGDWVGRWVNGPTSVDITPGGLLSATINDSSSEPAFFLTEEFRPGPQGLVSGRAALINSLIHAHVADPAARASLTKAAASTLALVTDASRTVTQVAESPRTVAAVVERLGPLIAENAVAQAASPTAARAVGRLIGALVQGQGGVAYLSDQVVLSLYRATVRGAEVGHELEFQRYDPLGNPLTSVMLKPAEKIA